MEGVDQVAPCENPNELILLNHRKATVARLLAWAIRPLKKVPLSVDEVFAALSEERHYARLPQILQSLREDDTEFLRAGGHGELFSQLRGERKRIALHYLN